MHAPWNVFAACLSLAIGLGTPADPPKVGDSAGDFTLKTPAGKPVQLSKLTEAGPVVLVVLRGFPGYQCPLCTKQVRELTTQAKGLSAGNARVVMVYPGPAKELNSRANEFLDEKSLPEGFTLVIDPDYTFTDAYHLRWNAKNETAYPSTFVIDRDGKIRFAKISKTHGDRAATKDVLKAIAGLK